jgi:hypothetical protein
MHTQLSVWVLAGTAIACSGQGAVDQWTATGDVSGAFGQADATGPGDADLAGDVVDAGTPLAGVEWADTAAPPLDPPPVAAPSGCEANGLPCNAAAACCSGTCDASAHVCVAVGSACAATDTPCSDPLNCCSHVCAGGKCGANACVSDGEACNGDSGCCSGKCVASSGGGSSCAALNGTCKTVGNKCEVGGDCCSQLCQNGTCSNKASFCAQVGEACVVGGTCCSGVCNLAAGLNLGTCAAPPSVPGGTQCTVAGQVCGLLLEGATMSAIPQCGGSCCSRACAPFGPSGLLVCQPASGCRPTGDLCANDAECCGYGGVKGKTGTGHCSKLSPGAPFGRCDNGKACRPAGAVCKLNNASCNAEVDCCAGNSQVSDPPTCLQDALGVPRCVMKPGACEDGKTVAIGTACASSADCCGKPCVPNLAAASNPKAPAFVCGGDGGGGGGGGSGGGSGGGCQDDGSPCSTRSDCCLGFDCISLANSTTGLCHAATPLNGGADPSLTCGVPGQACAITADCCQAPIGLVCSAVTGQCEYPVQ